MLLGMSMGEGMASSTLARNCFWASNPIPALRMFDCEVQLALPPVHWSVLPSLVSHIDVSSERVVLIVREDVREFHLEAVPFVINHNLLAGQRECLLLFEMFPSPIFYGAFGRESRLVHRYVRHTHGHSKYWTGLCSRHCLWGAGGRSLWAHVLPPLAQYQCRVREWHLWWAHRVGHTQRVL